MALQTFGSIIRAHAARKASDAPAITYGDDTLTWAELEQRSNRRSRQLQSLGVEQDDLVAINLPNGVAFHETLVATWKAGATPCCVSSRLPGRELAEIFKLAKPRLTLGEPPAEDTGLVNVDLAADLTSFDDAPTSDLAPRHWKAVASGGSTGRPKIIVDHMAARADPDALPTRFMQMPQDGVMLNPGPLYHNGPLVFTSYALLHGCHVVGMRRFDAEEALKLIERYKVQWVSMVPTMMRRIWALPPDVRERYDVSSLRAVWHMAAPCPPWLKRWWIDWLGADKIWETYAGTESAGTAISGTEWLAKPGSVGYADPARFRITREDGTECDVGEVGEIGFPNAARETFHYLGATKTDDAKRFTIGDLGYVDADHYLFLADRRTDMILRGGANIYPAEVEAALDEHPMVASSAVIGLPSDDLGQEVHAIVEARPGTTLDIGTIDTFLRDRLASYKRPRSYEIVSEPLRDDAGKVRRSRLRTERSEWLAAGQLFKLDAW